MTVTLLLSNRFQRAVMTAGINPLTVCLFLELDMLFYMREYHQLIVMTKWLWKMLPACWMGLMRRIGQCCRKSPLRAKGGHRAGTRVRLCFL